ncbi:hypothetical protein ABZU86_21950 [Streptomyces sp. NPDC005271]|uniref:hypothetical protein n=1 Tax=unclassified Streptomyces TaxID=2593676 RepID=UPI0033B1ED2D
MSQQQNRFARHKVLTGTGTGTGTCALVAVITLGGVAGGGHNGDGENGGTDTKASSADGGSGTTSKASGQKAIVTIGADNTYFKTNGCKNWKKTG